MRSECVVNCANGYPSDNQVTLSSIAKCLGFLTYDISDNTIKTGILFFRIEVVKCVRPVTQKSLVQARLWALDVEC